MTQRARRIYYLIAITFFLLLAPLILLRASGFSWAGFDFGWQRTGALTIHSTPRATIYVNGENRGATPKRFSNLIPGSYQVELRRPGYGSWRRTLMIEADTAKVINPVRLFPAKVRRENIAVPEGAMILGTPDQRAIYQFTPTEGSWSGRQIWPQPQTAAFPVPEQPEQINMSPGGQVLVVTSRSGSSIIRASLDQPVWNTSRLEHPLWDTATDQVLYGVQDGYLVRFDISSQILTRLEPATAATASGNVLYFVTAAEGQTQLWRRLPQRNSPASVVTSLPGTWSIAGVRNQLIAFTSQDEHTLRLLRLNLPSQLVWETVGGPFRFFAPGSNTGPWLLQNGAELNAIDAQGAVTLIARGPQEYQAAIWLHIPHIVLTVDNQEFIIRSVSSLQGRSDLLRERLGVNIQLLGLSRTDRAAVFIDQQNPTKTVTVVRW